MSYEITGSRATAIVHASDVEVSCNEQILEICGNEFLKGERIRIMPDCHAGTGICVGFTSTIRGDWAVPAYIGVDIGCGVSAHSVGFRENIDFRKFDNHVRAVVPSGKEVHNRFDESRCKEAWAKTTKSSMRLFLDDLKELVSKLNLNFRSEHYVEQSIGTLGGGNHFISLDKNKNGEVFAVVHSGSRNLGLKIANHFQNKVGEQGFLSGELLEDYTHAMNLAQKYASFNRTKILWEMLRYFNIPFDIDNCVESVHNYIDLENHVIRKGAISARKGETCLVPLNMADGILLCKGKGNEDWNCSAPHGAGRVLGRNRSKKELSMEEYRKRMNEKGVWSSCVNNSTLDESPMAYKSREYLERFLGETVEVIDHWDEIYNFKAAD